MFLEKIKIFTSKNLFFIVLITLLIAVICIEGFLIFKFNHEKLNIKDEKIAIKEELNNNEAEDQKTSIIKVDIKGAVKNPGVYEANDTMIINDVISLAGGLLKESYTNNINLSKKVSDEMVIYIYTKSEFKKLNILNTSNTTCTTTVDEVDKCIKSGQSIIETKDKNQTIVDASVENKTTESSIININTATVDELMTLTGVGESKAKSIIEYRELNGFFEAIEDIKNVSGIGDALFEKIKNNITI